MDRIVDLFEKVYHGFCFSTCRSPLKSGFLVGIRSAERDVVILFSLIRKSAGYRGCLASPLHCKLRGPLKGVGPAAIL